jgi:hypothetical protein
MNALCTTTPGSITSNTRNKDNGMDIHVNDVYTIMLWANVHCWHQPLFGSTALNFMALLRNIRTCALASILYVVDVGPDFQNQKWLRMGISINEIRV